MTVGMIRLRVVLLPNVSRKAAHQAVLGRGGDIHCRRILVRVGERDTRIVVGKHGFQRPERAVGLHVGDNGGAC